MVKLSYEELEKKLSYCESVLDKVNCGIAIYECKENKADFIFKYINKAVEDIEKIHHKNVIGRSVKKVFPGIKEFGLLDVFQRVWMTGEAERYPVTLYKDERISGWRDNHISKLSDTEIVVVYTDDTVRQEEATSMKESEFFYQTVFDTIKDGITVLDTDMNIVKMNRAMEEWYSPEKPYLGNKCYQTYHSRDVVCEDCPAQKAIKSGKLETRIVPRGGPAGTPGWIELSAFPIVNLSGGTIGAVEYVRNITERKKTEEKLINSEKKLKETIEFLPDPTWVINKKGEVILWNHAIERLTNIKAEDIVGKSNYEYAIPFFGKRRPVLIDLALEPDKALGCDYNHLNKKRKIITNTEDFYPLMGQDGLYLSATASPLYDSSGEIIGGIETVRDITKQKLFELEKEKNTKEELAKALSNVKLLSGLLPICATCKKIRDDSGDWNQLEEYIDAHSEAEFSHGICPQCVEEFYKANSTFFNPKDKP